MNGRLRGIGELARDSGLTVSALRFYDTAGVLVPASVDPRTGYRRYGDNQVRDARLIARLRRVGMPLAEICAVLRTRSDPPAARQLLDAHLTRLEDGLADARRELSTIRALLDVEGTPMTAPTRLTVAAADLAAALDAVRFAVCPQDADLPAITGILFDVSPDDHALRLVATDRYRMAMAEPRVRDRSGGPASATVPVTLADELRALLVGADDATITIGSDQVTVEVNGRQVRGPRVDHDFPDYRRLMRRDSTHRIPVDAAVLREALVTTPARTLSRDTGSAEVSVLAVRPDGAVAVVADESGDGLRVGVQREFLLEALAAAAQDQLVLELDGPITPLAIRTPGRDGTFSILMPWKLTGS